VAENGRRRAQNGAGRCRAKKRDHVSSECCQNNVENLKLCSRQAKNAQKRVLKVKRPNPDLDIFEKVQFYHFYVSGIYSRLLSGDVTEYGVNVAKITRMSKCTLKQNGGKIRQIKTNPLTMMYDF
jgi:hypothetical protein